MLTQGTSFLPLYRLRTRSYLHGEDTRIHATPAVRTGFDIHLEDGHGSEGLLCRERWLRNAEQVDLQTSMEIERMSSSLLQRQDLS